MQIRGDWGKVSVAWSMARRRNCKLYLWRWWGMNGRWGCAGAHSMCPMQHGLFWWKRIPNHHLRISSPQVSGWVAPPQASPFPLWPLTLTDLPLTGLANSIQRLHFWVRSGSSVPEIPLHLLWTPTGTTITEDGLCAKFPEHRKYRQGYQDLSFAHVDPYDFPSMLHFQMVIFPCNSSSDSQMMNRLSVLQGHLVRN